MHYYTDGEHIFCSHLESLPFRTLSALPEGQAVAFLFQRPPLQGRDAFAVSTVALYLHLADQLQTGLFTPAQANDWADHLLNELAMHFQFEASAPDASQPLELRLEHFLAGLLLAHLREQERLYPAS